MGPIGPVGQTNAVGWASAHHTLLSTDMRQPIKLDYLWAGCCLLGAVYFIFRA